MVLAPFEAVDGIPVPFVFSQENEKDRVTFFGKVGGLGVRLHSIVTNSPGLTLLLRPLLDRRKGCAYARGTAACCWRGPKFECNGAPSARRKSWKEESEY